MGILTCSNRDLMIELPTDHAKSFCSAFLVTSLDGVVSNVSPEHFGCAFLGITL